jgi:hypothetical protein
VTQFGLYAVRCLRNCERKSDVKVGREPDSQSEGDRGRDREKDRWREGDGE